MARKRKQKPEQLGLALDYIIEPLRQFACPVGDLTLDPQNARKHDDANMQSIIDSLSQFGQRMPIVVQKQGMVVRAGNGRLLAARKLGWSHISALVVDEKDVDATAYALADNRTGELAAWDYDKLLEQFDALGNLGVDLTQLGWSQEELDSMMSTEFKPDAIGDMPTPEDKKTLALTADQHALLTKAHKDALKDGAKEKDLAEWIVAEFTEV